MIDLETKFSFQESLLQELQEELLAQQRQIAALTRELGAVKVQLAEVIERDTQSASASDALERPPHY